MADATPGVDRPIEVIIADDHGVVRDGIRTVLERHPDELRVVAEAADVPSTVREVREHKPDLLTLDLTMPGGSSLAALPQCFIAHPSLAVAILTMREDPEYARQALRAGARSYVLKEAEPAELLQAFRLAVAGQSYLHPRLGAQIAAGDDAGGERHHQAHGRPATRGGAELELAAHELGPLAHARHAEAALEPIAARTQSLEPGQAAAVVGHRRIHRAVAFGDADDRLARMRVSADVREGLLHDSVDRALELRVQAPPLALRAG